MHYDFMRYRICENYNMIPYNSKLRQSCSAATIFTCQDHPSVGIAICGLTAVVIWQSNNLILPWFQKQFAWVVQDGYCCLRNTSRITPLAFVMLYILEGIRQTTKLKPDKGQTLVAFQFPSSPSGNPHEAWLDHFLLLFVSWMLCNVNRNWGYWT